jgi:type VI secretion system secreted protein VgrG
LAVCSAAVFLCFLGTSERAAATTIPLGTAANLAILAGSTVTNTGASTINGNVDVYPGTSVTGMGRATLTGTIHAGDAVANQALMDTTSAYKALQALTGATILTGQNLGGLLLTSGVYSYSSSAQLTGSLVLNFAGASNEEVVFQIGSSLTTASGSSVIVENGNSTDKVFFAVGSSATLGSGSSIESDILALDSIAMNDGAKIPSGRALALTGAVTLIDNTVSASSVGISAVPLPAAWPVFGMAIASLVGFGMWKRTAKCCNSEAGV